MSGLQETVYERLMEIAAKVRDGAYGTGDAIDMDEVHVDLEDDLADCG